MTFQEFLAAKFPQDPTTAPMSELTLWALKSTWTAALDSVIEKIEGMQDDNTLSRYAPVVDPLDLKLWQAFWEGKLTVKEVRANLEPTSNGPFDFVGETVTLTPGTYILRKPITFKRTKETIIEGVEYYDEEE
jgi:hypothetical protein